MTEQVTEGEFLVLRCPRCTRRWRVLRSRMAVSRRVRCGSCDNSWKTTPVSLSEGGDKIVAGKGDKNGAEKNEDKKGDGQTAAPPSPSPVSEKGDDKKGDDKKDDKRAAVSSSPSPSSSSPSVSEKEDDKKGAEKKDGGKGDKRAAVSSSSSPSPSSSEVYKASGVVVGGAGGRTAKQKRHPFLRFLRFVVIVGVVVAAIVFVLVIVSGEPGVPLGERVSGNLGEIGAALYDLLP